MAPASTRLHLALRVYSRQMVFDGQAWRTAMVVHLNRCWGRAGWAICSRAAAGARHKLFRIPVRWLLVSMWLLLMGRGRQRLLWKLLISVVMQGVILILRDVPKMRLLISSSLKVDARVLRGFAQLGMPHLPACSIVATCLRSWIVQCR
jgi:hypothetical protein